MMMLEGSVKLVFYQISGIPILILILITPKPHGIFLNFFLKMKPSLIPVGKGKKVSVSVVATMSIKEP